MRKWVLGCLAGAVVAAILLVPAAAGAAGKGRPGTLDPSFGKGKVFGLAPKAVAHSEFGASALEADGDLVVELHREVVETEGGVREVERRLPNGSLDPSFGKEGRVRVGLGSGLAVRPDGSIVVGVGSCGSTKGSLLVLDSSGNPATSFGEGGCGPRLGFVTKYIDVTAAGTIFIGGNYYTDFGGTKSIPKYEPAVAKLEADGALDPSFGKGGIVRLQVDLGVKAEAFEARAIDGIAPTAAGGVVVAAEQLLIGLEPNGALAPGFASGGMADVGAFSTALAALPDGDLVVAASVKTYSFQPATAMVVSRYLPNGTLDPSFGAGGRFTVPLPEETEASALAPAPEEGVLVAGETGHGKECRSACHVTMFLARIGAAGQYDSSYGDGGVLDLPLPPNQGYERSPGISALAVSAAGAAVVTGGESSDYGYAIAATPSGALDGSFGEGGTLLERHLSPSNLEPSGLAIGPKGAITVAAEGTAGEVEYGGFLLSFLANGRQTRGTSGQGVSPTEARGEIAPTLGGFASLWDDPPLHAVDKQGATLRSYGEKSMVNLPKGFRANAIVPGGGGRVLVLGRIGWAMAVLELGPKGRPVSAFGHRGLVKVGFKQDAGAEAAAITKAGAIFIAGYVGGWTGVAKLLPNGHLDRRFGRGGRVGRLLRYGTYGTSVASFAGGVVIGSTVDSHTPYKVAGLVRLDAEGHLVRTFGRHGAVRPNAEGRLLGVFAQGGRIVVVSDNEFARHSPGGVELRAYRADGSHDLGFGKRGLATGGASQRRFFHPVAAAQQPDGKIVVAGAAWNGELSQVELLRFR